MSNTGVSTLFSKIFVQTLNPQHAGKENRQKESPRRTPSEANPWNLRVPGEGRLA